MNKFPTNNIDTDKLMKKIPPSCRDVELFARGKRGVIFKAKYNDKKSIACCTINREISPEEINVVVKVASDNSDAKSTTLLEGNYLDKVNFFGIGPTVYDYNEDYVIMEFVEGELIGEWIKRHSQENNFQNKLNKVFENVLIQLEVLDQAKLNKFEMTNPYKHIIIKDDLNIVLIDFERMGFTARPKNVSQFKEYMRKIFSEVNEKNN